VGRSDVSNDASTSAFPQQELGERHCLFGGSPNFFHRCAFGLANARSDLADGPKLASLALLLLNDGVEPRMPRVHA
jgi:hypothetical protein